jgi:hypothetical protein
MALWRRGSEHAMNKGPSIVNQRIAELAEHIHRLEAEMAVELAKRRVELSYSVKGRVVRFEEHVLKMHRNLKTPLLKYILSARPLLIITAPVIYSLIIPFALLDLFVTVYQHICFPIYGIPRVRRADFLVLDRGLLAYLNAIEKLNCTYCSYANGIITYVREVASLTEQYWCPIKHSRRLAGAHDRASRFADYGDAAGYRAELTTLRQQLRSKH